MDDRLRGKIKCFVAALPAKVLFWLMIFVITLVLYSLLFYPALWQPNYENASNRQFAEVEADLVNINKAPVEELMVLPGIGITRAQAIVAYREEHGLFASTQELLNVKGIGQPVFEKLADFICV